MTELALFDWIVIGGYFVLVFGVAGWAVFQERSTQKTSAGYFLAGRNVGWFVIGTSLFASNIGSEHLIGLAGDGARVGLVVGQFEVLASLILLLLGWVFVPFYIKSGVYTMPEFLERRFSPAARGYLAGVSILAYVITKISVTIFAGAVVFQAVGVPFWTGAFVIVMVTGLYTIVGGLRAVIYTDMIQAVLLILGSVTVTLAGLAKLGGWGALTEIAGPSFFDMWRPMSDPDFPWTGILFGAPILGIWYWCTDQFIVQRTLSARNLDNARRGALWGGYLKMLPLFIFVLPGIVAYALVQQGQLTLDDPNGALPALIQALLPVGLRGLLVAGLLAALMSSLSSVFNSCSTLITWDLYKKIDPGASERRLVLVGQLATVVLVVLGIAWIPLMDRISEGLYTYIQSVQAYISPPIAAVFLLGILWPRINAAGAMSALLSGFVVGIGRLVAEVNRVALEDTFLHGFATINFLHFAIFLFVACTVVLVGVSLATDPPPREKTDGLTFGRAGKATAGTGDGVPGEAAGSEADEAAKERPAVAAADGAAASEASWRRRDAVLSGVLVLIVVVIWLIFS